MLAVARTLTTATPAGRSFVNFYSTISGLKRRDWGLNSSTTPTSLLDNSETDGPRDRSSTISGLKRRGWGLNRPTSLRSSSDSLESDDLHDRDVDAPTKHFNRNGRFNSTSTPQQWRKHRETMKESFPKGWSPGRKLSREAMDGLRSLHATDPKMFSTTVLADKFRVSPEAVRRILKSKWTPSREQRAKLMEKERRLREEWVAARRAEERKQLLALQQERDKLDKALGKVVGANKKDKLSLA